MVSIAYEVRVGLWS